MHHENFIDEYFLVVTVSNKKVKEKRVEILIRTHKSIVTTSLSCHCKVGGVVTKKVNTSGSEEKVGRKEGEEESKNWLKKKEEDNLLFPFLCLVICPENKLLLLFRTQKKWLF